MLLKAEQYLKENIDSNILIKTWNKKNEIPIFLRGLYNFYTAIILDIPVVFVEIIDQGPGIEVTKKHIALIQKATSDNIVFYYKKISRYRRKTLIENRIPFVIEDGQIFLPFLGLHLKNSDQIKVNKIKPFSPSEQIAFLYFLYNRHANLNTTEISKIFEWSVMTASRALNKLYNSKLLTYEVDGKTGRSKRYRRISDPDYFEKGSAFLNSPVNKVVYVNKLPQSSFISGLEALSELSMINPPGHHIRAIDIKNFNNENLETIENLDIINDKNLIELQIWEYNPELFTTKRIVDIASLYASLKEENDERIEQALSELLGGEEWYMD